MAGPDQHDLRGAVGFAEAYVRGDWESESLEDVLKFFADNLDGLGALVSGWGPLRVVNRLIHGLNRNSRRGSRRNISFHYDLGNAFYSQWLDDSMSYSAGMFAPGDSLEAAQRRKNAHLCEMADVKAGQEVLEIGCGWGGLLEHLGELDCSATGVSVSSEQVGYAAARLQDQPGVAVRLQDYRDIQGRFDRIVSVEMFEAVGAAYWDVFAAKVSHLLAEDGVAALQVITIDEAGYDAYQARPDFIQKHIFPGGMLPTVTHLRQVFSKQGLQLTRVHRFGQDYATTLQHWRKRFEKNWAQMTALGFDESFYRLWRYYLLYCELGFRTGRTDVVQIRVEKSAWPRITS